jgi:hypothetical protein
MAVVPVTASRTLAAYSFHPERRAFQGAYRAELVGRLVAFGLWN